MSSNALGPDSTNGQHSLAHELAVALMPEPSPGSRLLAEEFGIEYDEGAEGIDVETKESELVVCSSGSSLADEFEASQPLNEYVHSVDASSSHRSPHSASFQVHDEAPMASLTKSMESTDHFLSHLKSLDSDTHSTTHPTIEHIASDMLRRINETVRDREEQVRELLEAEREFRKISAGLGGNEVLASLDGLDAQLDPKTPTPHAPSTTLESAPLNLTLSPDWDIDSRTIVEDDHTDPFIKPPPIQGPLTPAKAIPQMSAFRTFTSSLAASLVAISEQTQVTGAATTEAGRKIRALKNKLSVWQIELDNAELSRLRVERWEAGIPEGDSDMTPIPPIPRRIDGRKIVAEHLRLFELCVAEATTKTQAIMTM